MPHLWMETSFADGGRNKTTPGWRKPGDELARTTGERMEHSTDGGRGVYGINGDMANGDRTSAKSATTDTGGFGESGLGKILGMRIWTDSAATSFGGFCDCRLLRIQELFILTLTTRTSGIEQIKCRG